MGSSSTAAPGRAGPGANGQRGATRALVAALALSVAWVALVRPGPIDLPYWWDEADVYVPGSKWVAENDLVVTPGVFPDDYSRGHPVLLYAMAGAAFRAFGPEPATGHLVVLPFTVLALFFTYLLGATLFDRRTGFAALALMAATPLFMSMGNMLLPEMPLTTLAVAGFAFYARRQLGAAIVCGCLAVWIKETGVFAAAAITGALLFEGYRAKAYAWKRIALSTLPVWALVGFFVWQKVHAGYFVFPHHANLFADRPLELSNLLTVWPSLLLWHGRWIVLVAAVIAFAVARGYKPTTAARALRVESTAVAIVLLVLANFVFFSKMFWLERYALPAHPGLLVLAAGALFASMPTTFSPRSLLRVAPVALSFGLGVLGLWAPTEPDAEEQTFVYADAIGSHQDAFEALAREPEVRRVLTPWPMQVELRYPYLGYVESPLETIHPRSRGDATFDAILFGSRSWRAPELRDLAAELGFTRHQTFQVGDAPPLELYLKP